MVARFDAFLIAFLSIITAPSLFGPCCPVFGEPTDATSRLQANADAIDNEYMQLGSRVEAHVAVLNFDAAYEELRRSRADFITDYGSGCWMAAMCNACMVQIDRVRHCDKQMQARFEAWKIMFNRMQPLIWGDPCSLRDIEMLEGTLQEVAPCVGMDGHIYIDGLILIGLLQNARKDYKAADESLSRAYELYGTHIRKDTPQYGRIVEALAFVKENMGRLEDSARLQAECMAVREHIYGPKSPYVAACLINLSSVQLKQQKLSEAEASIGIAMKLLAPLGEAWAANGIIQFQHAKLHLAKKEFDEAERCFAEAEKGFESLSPAVSALVEVYELHAIALEQLKRLDEAKRLRERVDEMRAKVAAEPEPVLSK